MPSVVTAAEANRRFSALLKRARAGETVEITSHGETVAYLVPKTAGVDEDIQARRMAMLRFIAEEANKRPVQNIGPWTRDELYDD